MTSAKVNISEVDLSTRVPQFPGAFGGMVVPSKKGPIGEAVLVTSEAEFLRRFTPNERIDVGFDNAHFSAITFLEKSDKLWVSRAANNPLFGGAVIRDGSTGGSNAALSSGLSDPSAFTFDTGIDVAAVAQVIQAVFTQAGSFYDISGNAKALSIYDGGNVRHDFWFNVTDGANSQNDPALGGTPHQVDILSGDTSNDVASKFAAVADGLAEFSASATTGTVDVTNATAGDADDPIITDSAVDSTSVVTQGADSVSGVDEVLLIYGANPGAWNNDIAIKITNFATNPEKVQEPDSFLLEVFKTSNLNVALEAFNVSRVPGAKTLDGANLFVEEVLEQSSFIRAISNPAIDESVVPQDQLTALTLASGDDGLAVSDSHMIEAAQVFKNKDNLNVTILMDGGFASPAYHLELDSICQTRLDCVAVLSVPFADEASANFMSDIIDYRSTDLNLNSNRSALYTPHVKVFDKFNDRNIFIAPDGFAGGAISFSAAEYEIWFPPAGARRGIVSALDVRRRFNEAQRDQLQLNGINPLRFTTGRGILIWGQKTLQSRPSALDRLNVRLLLIVIENAIALALEDFLFELNDTATRSLAKAIIDSFLDNILSRRGVTDFRTVIDDTNNTPEDVENNRLNVDVFVKPTRSVETINLRTIITRTGVSFDTAATQV